MTEQPKDQASEKRGVTVLRHLREQAGLTREQLVTRLNNRISVRTLSRWENEGLEPSMTRQDWIDFCEAVGVPFEQLPRQLSVLVSSGVD